MERVMKARFVWCAALCAALTSCSAIVKWKADPPSDVGPLDDKISERAQALIRHAYDGITPGDLFDHHVHLAGQNADSGQGCAAAKDTWINPRRDTWCHPKLHAAFIGYKTAGGVSTEAGANMEYLDRLRVLATAWPQAAGKRPDGPSPIGRFLVLPFSRRYDEGGQVNCEHTDMFVSNEWAFEHGQAPFVPAMSVHPDSPDAIKELERWSARSKEFRILKWLPSAMGIDPSQPRYDRFYACMAELGIVLLTHGGEERAIDAPEKDQKLANPLLLRSPLKKGVTVIVAHAASTGDGVDPDAGTVSTNFDLFQSLMREHKERLYGELSATILENRDRTILTTLLDDPALQKRLVNGSDYPLPAIGYLLDLERFESWGLLEKGDAAALEEIRERNPLIFDFVLKRSLRTRKPGRPDAYFDPAIFKFRPELMAPSVDHCTR